MSSVPSHDLGVLLNLSFVSFRNALDSDLAAAGYDDLGSSFGYVFRRLAEGPSSLSELAELLSMTPPGALKVVDDMVAKGYVTRSADPSDRRVKRLALTSRGKAALKRARQFHASYERALAERLGAAKVAAARQVLEAVISEACSSSQRPRPA
jgi:DNA-binding MarR family transcriptional regulator